MRRSTALTFEMIKTSNRLQMLKRLGLGAGILGAGGLGAALGAQYLGTPSADAAMGGGEGGFFGGVGPMLSDALKTARDVQSKPTGKPPGGFGGAIDDFLNAGRKTTATALSMEPGLMDLVDRTYGAIADAKDQAMYSPVPTMARNMANNASFGLFDDTAEPSLKERMLMAMAEKEPYAVSAADRIFGAPGAARDAAGRLGGISDFFSASPRGFLGGLDSARSAAGRVAGAVGDATDFFSASPRGFLGGLDSARAAAGRVGGAAGDVMGLMDPTEVGEWSPSTWQRIGDQNMMNRVLARSIPRMPADFATRGGGSAGLMSAVPAY